MNVERITFRLIHPSRSRPQKAFRTFVKWMSLSRLHTIHPGIQHSYVVSVDGSDPELNNYRAIYYQHSHVFSNDNRTAIEAINIAAQFSLYPGCVAIIISDDTDCFEGWDIAIAEVVQRKTDFVVKFGDGIQKRIITMPVFDYQYYKRDGFVYNPIYDHSFCDTEYTEIAHLRKRVIDRTDIVFKHLHPEVTGEQRDALQLRNDATHDSGRKIFQERQRINFGI